GPCHRSRRPSWRDDACRRTRGSRRYAAEPQATSIPDGVDLDCDGVADMDLGVDVDDWLECRLPAITDGDADGIPDGVDMDCDGACDVDIEAEAYAACESAPADLGDLPFGIDLDCDSLLDVSAAGAGCEPVVSNVDGDGIPDAIDLDCDGVVDIDIP
ncbi:MAG: MopE-related protein, partial [Deltaproteobacteria bacterium]